MKKSIILICLILIILLISCTMSAEQEQPDYITASRAPDIQVNGQLYDENIYEFTSRGKFFTEDESVNSSDFLDYRDSWYYQLESIYNIKLKCHDNFNSAIGPMNGMVNTAAYFDAVKTGIDHGTIGGMLTMLNFESVKTLMECGYILPLNDYIINNTEWRALPTEWKTAFTIDGQIWALPYTFQRTVKLRRIRTDWLDNLNLEKPITVDDFYEVMRGFTYEDPDIDGINNTYGASFSDWGGFADIFGSFDARFNQNAQAVPIWNPNTNLWEDSFLKKSFSDCLNFLKNCYDEKIIVNDFNSFSNGYSGSIYNEFTTQELYAKSSILKSRPDNKEPEIGYIIGLSNYIDTNITGYYTEYQTPMVMTKNSKYPSSTINIFLDNFMTDYNCHMTARFGIGEYPFVINGKLQLYTDDTTYEDYETHYPFPNLIGNSPFYEYYPIYNHGNEDDMNARISYAQRINLVENNDMCYMIPNEYIYLNSDAKMERNMNELALISGNLIMNIIRGNVSYEDALDSYRNSAKQQGMQEFLDYQNSLLGKTSEQHY